jgi:isoleucyl-tRNA synthetase
VQEVKEYYEEYEPTRAGRAIQNFVIENLSNWYVRLNRKRFWGGDLSDDKKAAYQTLYTCLETIAKLMAPISPMFADRLFKDLTAVSGTHRESSVHLATFAKYDEALIDKDLEERMDIAQRVSSMILGLRRKVNIKVRQPLAKLMLPITHASFRDKFEAIKELVLNEVNVKEVAYITDTAGVIEKKIKPNFKTLGPKYGKLMKFISKTVNQMGQEDIVAFEKSGSYTLEAQGETIELSLEDVEISTEDIPGLLVANDGDITVALDISLTEELKSEGIAREFVNRIQNLRKSSNFEVTDKIKVAIERHEAINQAIDKHASYIGTQTLATQIDLVDKVEQNEAHSVELDDEVQTRIFIEKIAN